MINLATDPAYQEVLREMATRMWQRIHETDDFNMASSHQWTFCASKHNERDRAQSWYRPWVLEDGKCSHLP
jgi:hypothetical protein